MITNKRHHQFCIVVKIIILMIINNSSIVSLAIKKYLPYRSIFRKRQQVHNLRFFPVMIMQNLKDARMQAQITSIALCASESLNLQACSTPDPNIYIYIYIYIYILGPGCGQCLAIKEKPTNLYLNPSLKSVSK